MLDTTHETPTDTDTAPEPPEPRPTDRRRIRRITISIRSLLVLALVLALAILAWCYLDARNDVEAIERQQADYRRAEQVALDYAVGAAEMNYQDLAAWHTNLVRGTSPEMTNKLNQAATAMEQIIVPVQWMSTSTPLTAKVRSHEGDVYVVDSFVGVVTKNTQAPDGLQSTATYSITLDRSNDWQITDVGGIGAVTGAK